MQLMAMNVQRTCPVVPLVLTVWINRIHLPSPQPPTSSTPAPPPPAQSPPTSPPPSSEEYQNENDATTTTLVLTSTTTAQSLVEQLGEPSRKGGGDQTRLGPAAWLEWCVQLYLPPSPLTLAEGHHHQQQQQQQPTWIPARIHIGLRGPHARGTMKWEKDAGGQSTWDDVWIERANIIP